jgi:hypothetical protein
MERFWDSSMGALETGAADAADIDADGMETIAEYAFLKDPLAGDGPPPFSLAIAPDGLPAFSFPRVPVHVDLAYAVEHSGDLQGWQAVAGSLGGAPAVPLDPALWRVNEVAGPTTTRVEVKPATAGESGFFRLRFEHPPVPPTPRAGPQ